MKAALDSVAAVEPTVDARCRASNRPPQLSVLSLSTLPSTTSSTSNDISSRVPPSAASVPPLIMPGTTRPLGLNRGGSRMKCAPRQLTCQSLHIACELSLLFGAVDSASPPMEPLPEEPSDLT